MRRQDDRSQRRERSSDRTHAAALESLEPGALSGPVVLKFRFEDPTMPQPIRFKVEGMVEPQQ